MLQKSGEKTTERMVLKPVENHGIKLPTSTGERRISEPATIIKHGGLELTYEFRALYIPGVPPDFFNGITWFPIRNTVATTVM